MNHMQLRLARAIRAAEVEGKSWEPEQVAPYPQFDELWQNGDKERYLEMAKAAMNAMGHPTDKMVRAGEAWRAHCSDTDSLWGEMVSAALCPEHYPGEDEPFDDSKHILTRTRD